MAQSNIKQVVEGNSLKMFSKNYKGISGSFINDLKWSLNIITKCRDCTIYSSKRDNFIKFFRLYIILNIRLFIYYV